MRNCDFCGEEIVPWDSRRRKSDTVAYCNSVCKRRAYTADGRQAAAGLKSYYKRRYGMSADEVAALRASGCAICGADDGGGRHGTLHVDHCHRTGQIRGALCDSCNLGLGKFKDNPALLDAAAAYLRRNR